MEEPARRDLEAAIGHRFADPQLLRAALVHRSWVAEHAGETSNEQLEFLGDAVLGFVVSDHVFLRHPDLSEGEWSKVRASVVNTERLAEVARSAGVGEALLLGKGEDAGGGRDKVSILADAMEAVFAAVYLDAGIEMARRVILDLLGDRIAAAAQRPGGDDPKTILQELALLHEVGLPRYRVTGEGPDHEKRFTAVVLLDGVQRGTGEGVSKKAAEQAAARVAAAWLTERSEGAGA